jgi:hypothetical protein
VGIVGLGAGGGVWHAHTIGQHELVAAAGAGRGADAFVPATGLGRHGFVDAVDADGNLIAGRRPEPKAYAAWDDLRAMRHVVGASDGRQFAQIRQV